MKKLDYLKLKTIVKPLFLGENAARYIQEKMPLPSIGENAVNGILYHRHFLLTPLNNMADM